MGGRHRLVIGIDFGTTYTGVSFAWSAHVAYEEIHRIEKWPAEGSNTEHAFKVPTQIAYAPGGTTTWGYQIPPGVPRNGLMKLLLDRESKINPHDDPGLKDDINKVVLNLPGGPKDADRITTDFFKELYNHTMDWLLKLYPMEIITLTPVIYWFTMPAIWSDAAQERTIRAAEEAGFIKRAKKDQAFAIAEPEAAALAAVTSTLRAFGEDIEKGDRFLVCDCGGGTVDLTSYLVKDDDPWELAECYPGEGGKCGGTYIDRNLRKLLSDRFGEPFTRLPHKNTGQGSRFMVSFEAIKRQFGSGNERPARLPLFLDLPSQINSQQYDASEGYVILSKEDLVTIFKPVVDEIIKLVSNQVKRVKESGKSINFLMLVGGLGESPHLRNELKSWCYREGIRITGPQDSWGIVSHGAVVRGLELALVKERKCRRHYGIQESRPFREGIDNKNDRRPCPFTGRQMVPGYMKWAIRRGDDVIGEATKPVVKDYYLVLDEGEREIRIMLMSCTEDDAPDRYDPRIVEDMKPIVADIGDVDMSKYETVRKQDGRLQYKFDFDLEAILGHRRGTIAFRLKSQGKIVAQGALEL